MSDFKFTCPKCGQHIACDTSNVGMQIPCPGCESLLTVPPPPPAVPGSPGKLSINKAAHAHSAPAPTGTAAPKPAWGAKPPPRPAPNKTKGLIKTGIITLCILVVAAVGWFAFGAPYLKKQAELEKQKQEEAARQQEEQAKAAAAAEEAARAKRAGWKMDIANAPFPDRPASGKLHTVNFTVETVLIQGGSLTLKQDTSNRQFVIPLPLKSGETLAGKSFQFTPADTNKVPRIVMAWKDDGAPRPSTLMFTNGYALKLEFGALADGKLPGKIYLSLPDPDQSFVGGNFEFASKKPGDSGANQQQRPPGGAIPNRRGGN